MVINTRERVLWLDVLKGIGIFYVVLGHMNAGSTPLLDQYINSFHMPLFFLISGFLFDFKKHAGTKEFMVKKVRTLLIPYLLFGMLGIPFEYLLTKVRGEAFSGWSSFYGLLVYDSWNGPLWFLTCLFLVEVMYYLIQRNITESIIHIVIVTLTATGFVLSAASNMKYFWRFDVAMVMLSLFHVGNIMKLGVMQISRELQNKPIKLFVFTTISAAVHIIFGVILNDRVVMSGATYSNYLYFYIAALAGTAFYYGVSLYLLRFRFATNTLSFYGENSLIVMSLHWILMFVIPSVIARVFGFENYFISTIVIMIAFMPIISIINNYFPFILGRKVKPKLRWIEIGK